jgi:tetratricopeptide (TPR) repeat protein
LGLCYREQGMYAQAKDCFNQAIQINPENALAYVDLGLNYAEQGKYVQAEDCLKQAIKINPQDYWAYIELGIVYRRQSKFDKAEEPFKRAMQLNPQQEQAYIGLCWCYREQGKFPEMEDLCKTGISLNPQNTSLYGMLESLYIEIGEPDLAREYSHKARGLRNYYTHATAGNYLKLWGILRTRGIKYVCMQYPLRSTDPLKQIFHGNAEGIIFVDNEKIFKDALRQAKFTDYFRDAFGGDFGHCTEKGNRLLAENIAKVIMKEVLNKRI